MVFKLFNMKKIKQIWNFLFNTNDGFFCQIRQDYNNGTPFDVYIVCTGFKFFGIRLYTPIDVFESIYEVNQYAKEKNVKINLV